MKLYTATFLLTLLSISGFCQQKSYVSKTFHGYRIVNGHSVEAPPAGEMEFLISHRFGRINQGLNGLFGLDQATIRLGLEYGITNWLTIGGGRSSFEKTLDGFAKLRLLRQANFGSPASITFLSSVAFKTQAGNNEALNDLAVYRLFYTHQLLIARKFSDRFSLQLMPTVVHRNYVESNLEKNDVIALGAATRFRVNKGLAITLEYYLPIPGSLAPDKYQSLGVGFEMNTGGHIFQIHLTNSQGMIEKFFITETTGDLRKIDLHIGFNITRTFKLRGRWY